MSAQEPLEVRSPADRGWRAGLIAVVGGVVALACGIAWAFEAALTMTHFDGQSLRVADAGNRFAVALLFFAFVVIGPIMAVTLYLWAWGGEVQPKRF